MDNKQKTTTLFSFCYSFCLVFCLLIACNSQKKNSSPNGESGESTKKVMLNLKGVILNKHGRPISDVIVTISSGVDNYPDIGVMSNEKGQFNFPDLNSGVIGLKFVSETQEMQKKVTLKKGQTSFEFKLE